MSTQSALNLDVNISALSKTSIGLLKVDSAANLLKPISNATQPAFDTKVGLVYDSC